MSTIVFNKKDVDFNAVKFVLHARAKDSPDEDSRMLHTMPESFSAMPSVLCTDGRRLHIAMPVRNGFKHSTRYTVLSDSPGNIVLKEAPEPVACELFVSYATKAIAAFDEAEKTEIDFPDGKRTVHAEQSSYSVGLSKLFVALHKHDLAVNINYIEPLRGATWHYVINAYKMGLTVFKTDNRYALVAGIDIS